MSIPAKLLHSRLETLKKEITFYPTESPARLVFDNLEVFRRESEYLTQKYHLSVGEDDFHEAAYLFHAANQPPAERDTSRDSEPYWNRNATKHLNFCVQVQTRAGWVTVQDYNDDGPIPAEPNEWLDGHEAYLRQVRIGKRLANRFVRLMVRPQS